MSVNYYIIRSVVYKPEYYQCRHEHVCRVQEEHPWTVLLNVITVTGAVYACGGTLLSPRVVMSAAHCLHDLQIDRIEVCLSEPNMCLYKKSRRKYCKLLQHRINKSVKTYCSRSCVNIRSNYIQGTIFLGIIIFW